MSAKYNNPYAKAQKLYKEAESLLKLAVRHADSGDCSEAMSDLRASVFREAAAREAYGGDFHLNATRNRIVRRSNAVFRHLLRKCGGRKAPSTARF